MSLADVILNYAVTIFLFEVPPLICLSYAIPALLRAGRSFNARVVVTIAALLSPGVALATGFAVQRLAALANQPINASQTGLIVIVITSMTFTTILSRASKARSLFFAGCAATIAAVSPVALLMLLLNGLGDFPFYAFLLVFSFPFWHLVLGSWMLGWSTFERHRMKELDPTCFKCGYDLRGLPLRVCPECGAGPGS